MTQTSERPDGICANCYAVWRAARPRPAVIRCWHMDAIARPTATGWKVMLCPTRATLTELRKEGLL